MKPVTIIALATFFCAPSPAQERAGNAAVWDAWLAALRQNIEHERWYDARSILAEMKAADRARFSNDDLFITAGWVAGQTRLWHMAARSYSQSNTALAPQIELELAHALIMDQGFARAKSVLTALPNRKLDRRLLWRKYDMLGRCHEALGEFDQARSAYKRLLGRGVPSSHRAHAVLRSAVIDYQLGRIRGARQMVNQLAHRWPSSDEALRAIRLQHALDDAHYCLSPTRLERDAWVFYRNREYQDSDDRYARLKSTASSSKARAKATYFLALTRLKREDPAAAVAYFTQAVEDLRDSVYSGMAHFQLARSLFMVGRDHDTILVADRAFESLSSQKWKWETQKLKLLALRRMQEYDTFQRIEAEWKTENPPAWIKRFYHRNGLVWSLHRDRPDDARHHLDQFKLAHPDRRERHELGLWMGLIHWTDGNHIQATQDWLAIARRDPNHYTGLLARELIEMAKQDAPIAVESVFDRTSSPFDQSLDGFLLGRTQAIRDQFSEQLAHQLDPLDPKAPERALRQYQKAAAWARIGRFDLAADGLTHENSNLNKRELHYVKALWYMKGQRLHDSIYHAEILARTYPTWAPYEALPHEALCLMFPRGYGRLIERQSRSSGVDPYLVLAIIREESRFDQGAKSIASARGLMQFIPSTATRVAQHLGLDQLDLDNLYEAETSVQLGAAYIDDLMDSFGGVPLFTVAAYNAGEDAVLRWRSMADGFDPVQFVWDITYSETRNYCYKVMGSYHHYKTTYQGQPSPTIIEAPSLARFSP